MILFHGTTHMFDWPEYADMVERNSSPNEHPRGLYVSTQFLDAAKYGRVFCVEVPDDMVELDVDAALLSEPRHKLVQAGKQVMIAPNGSGVIVDLDAIEDYFPIALMMAKKVESFRAVAA